MQTPNSAAVSSTASQLDIDSILKDVLKQWWVILLIAISAALLSGTLQKLTYTPSYATTTTFVVSKSGFSSSLAYENLKSAESVTTRFSQIADSSVLKKRVCEDLNLSWFNAEISVNVIPSSNLMSMTVTAASPREAYAIIHSVMEHAQALTAELMDSVAVKVLQEPSIPYSPRNPLNPTDAMKTSAVFGAAAITVLFILLSYFKDTIKNPREAAVKLDTSLLGTICHEKKYKTLNDRLHNRKIALNITNPAVSFSYVESIQMMATRIRGVLERRNAHILMVTSVSENEGKSTITANLALALSREGHKVVLIDCDFRKPSQYKIFRLSKDKLETDGLTEQLTGQSTLKFHRYNKDERLWLLCNAKPSQNFLNQQTSSRLKYVIESLRKKVDYVIIDTSPMALVSDGEAIAEYAQASLIVVQQDMMEAKYVNDVIDQLNKTNAPVIGCVLNNVHTGFFAKSGLSAQYMTNYHNHYYEHEQRSDSLQYEQRH